MNRPDDEQRPLTRQIRLHRIPATAIEVARMLLCLLVLTSCAGEAANAGSLAQTVARAGAAAGGPVWLAWEVPAAPTLHTACCLDRKFRPTVCYLEGKDQSWGSSSDSVPGSGRLLVLARFANGAVGRVRGVDSHCPVDAGKLSIVRLEGVSAAESVSWLADIATAAQTKRDASEPLAALAYHAGPVAEEALQRLAAEPHDDDLREQALFWIGQTRGESGASFLAGVVRRDPDSEIRKKAVFSLSQNESPTADDVLIEVARRDRDPEVRGDALFWLAQTGGDKAPQVLLTALDEDPSESVREKAIFAMTQLKGGEGVPLLMRIVREKRDHEVRRKALFWLGQSDDPRALDFLENILDP